MTVTDMLEAPVEFDHALEVRSIGPAIVLVLERDGPLRMETMASTESEFNALLDEVANNPKWNELLAVFDLLRSEEEAIPMADLWQRQEEHAKRLETGKRIFAYRVDGEIPQ